MIEIYVVFMFFAIHGCDDVLEECFSKYVPWNVTQILYRTEGVWRQVNLGNTAGHVLQIDVLFCRVLEKTLCLN